MPDTVFVEKSGRRATAVWSSLITTVVAVLAGWGAFGSFVRPELDAAKSSSSGTGSAGQSQGLSKDELDAVVTAKVAPLQLAMADLKKNMPNPAAYQQLVNQEVAANVKKEQERLYAINAARKDERAKLKDKMDATEKDKQDRLVALEAQITAREKRLDSLEKQVEKKEELSSDKEKLITRLVEARREANKSLLEAEEMAESDKYLAFDGARVPSKQEQKVFDSRLKVKREALDKDVMHYEVRLRQHYRRMDKLFGKK